MKKFVFLLLFSVCASMLFAAVTHDVISWTSLLDGGAPAINMVDGKPSEYTYVKTTKYTPSAEAKQAPEMVVPEEIPNIKYDAKINRTESSKDFFIEPQNVKTDAPIVLVSERKGDEGKIVGAVPQIDVEIVSYAAKHTLEEKDLEDVVSAFEDLRKAKNFSRVISDLQEFIDTEYEGKLAVTQIFFIKPTAEIVEFIDLNDLLNLRIIFKKALTAGGQIPVIAVKRAGTEEWFTIDPKTILEDVYGKDSFSVDFHYFGSVVFLEPRNL